jgi:predicted peptidase
VRSRRAFLVQGTQAAAAALLSARRPLDAQGAAQPISSATAITQVFGEGQKLTAVALNYGRAVDGKKLSTSTFQVEGRTATKMYASESATIGRELASGRYVIVELSVDDPAATLISSPAGAGPGGLRGAGPSDGPRDRAGAGGPPPQPGGPGGPGRGRSGGFPSPTLKTAQAVVVQTGPVTTSDGRVLEPNTTPIVTTHVQNLIVDDFRQLTYRDPQGRGEIRYNLFVPRSYDRNEKYPLVLFIHDAGTLSSDPRVTLAQGISLEP